jgi:CPA2 family monovalent cation:H+ antiporter-2
MILEALSRQSRAETAADPGEKGALPELDRILPGLGRPVSARIAPGSPAAGQSLGALDLRGVTGATVLAIRRGEEALVLPEASQVLRAGDLVAIAGTAEAVEAARQLLAGASHLDDHGAPRE